MFSWGNVVARSSRLVIASAALTMSVWSNAPWPGSNERSTDHPPALYAEPSVNWRAELSHSDIVVPAGATGIIELRNWLVESKGFPNKIIAGKKTTVNVTNDIAKH